MQVESTQLRLPTAELLNIFFLKSQSLAIAFSPEETFMIFLPGKET
jgi:hypothetical protein